jgi:DNA polymerase III epsilon subunit-like protein
MGIVMDDPAFLGATYVVIDFESLTPTGRPPVPVEVAAIAGRFSPAGDWEETGRFQSLMRPPDDVPVTSFDQAQTGLTARELDGQPPAAQVMAALDARLARPPYRLVAHSAHTEATLIAGQRQHCPVLADTSLLCTVRLSRAAFPELTADLVAGSSQSMTGPAKPRCQMGASSVLCRTYFPCLQALDSAFTQRLEPSGDADHSVPRTRSLALVG